MENVSQTKIVVKSKLEKDDYLKANKVVLKIKRNEIKKYTCPILFLIIFISFISGFVKGMYEDNTIPPQIQNGQLTIVPWYISFLPTIVLFVIFFIGLIILIKYYKNAAKRHYESNKLAQDEVQYTFDDTGIEYKSERSLIKIDWNEIFKIYISKDFFIILISDRTAWIIPKKNVESNDIPNLMDYFTAKVDSKKVKLVKH